MAESGEIMEEKQTIITRRNVIITLLVALVICIAILAVVITVHNTNKSISLTTTQDCSSSAVIRCGSSSTTSLKNSYNKSSYAKNVFSYFSITSSDINKLNKTAVAGTVSSKGNVYIQGDTTPVATNALVAIKTNKGTSGAIDYKSSYFALESPSQVFTTNSETAFVVMKKNIFQYAILASCDNPVIGTNITAYSSKTPSITSTKAPTSSNSSSSTTSSTPSSSTSSTNSSASTSSPATTTPATTSPSVTTTPTKTATTPLSSTGPSTTVSIMLFGVMSVIGTVLYRRRLVRHIDS